MTDIKLVVFDLNATLIDDHTWPKFQSLMGLTEEEDLLLWKLNKEGVLPNEYWAKIVNNIYRTRTHRTRTEITKSLLDFTYLPDAENVIAKIKAKYTVGIISGSPDILVEHIARKLKIDFFGSNAMILFDQEDFFQKLVVLDEEPQGKLVHLQAFCRRLGITPQEVACIGDGDNDLELFRATGHGITFSDSPITSEAWKTIDSLADLPSIL
jgi:phosphoserine phosphatase